MNFDDYISRDPMDGQWDRRAERHVEREPREVCRYCVAGERQVPWPPEAPTHEKCLMCGDTRAMRELTGAELMAEFAAVMRQKVRGGGDW